MAINSVNKRQAMRQRVGTEEAATIEDEPEAMAMAKARG
jgi:hypothetical protein